MTPSWRGLDSSCRLEAMLTPSLSLNKGISHKMFELSGLISISKINWATYPGQFHADPTAYLGITVPNFPNFFLLLGPNGVVGHNSATFMIECQVNYVSDCIAQMIKSGRSRNMAVVISEHCDQWGWLSWLSKPNPVATLALFWAKAHLIFFANYVLIMLVHP